MEVSIMSDKIRISVIGTGHRAVSVVGMLLNDSDHNVEIASVYDPDPSEMDYACDQWNATYALRCKSSQEAISSPRNVLFCSSFPVNMK